MNEINLDKIFTLGNIATALLAIAFALVFLVSKKSARSKR